MTERHDDEMTSDSDMTGVDMTDVDMTDVAMAEETVEVRRFADSLAALEAGRELDIDPSEDPELSELVVTSLAVTNTIHAATATPRFESYRYRSRAAILGRLYPANPTPEPRHFWQRRWLNFLAPVASAAAAAVLTLAFVIATDDPTPVYPTTAVSERPETLPGDSQSVSSSLLDRIEKIQLQLLELERRTNDGELVSADFLRALTEQHATVAADIARAEPGSLPDGIATSAFSTTITSAAILEDAKADPDSLGALEAARQQSQLARQVAESYLVATQFTITTESPVEMPSDESGEMPIEQTGEPF
jgi:hypothetical protein